MTDMFGGTPSNMSLSFLKENEVEVLTGVNLPMLLRVLNYRRLGMDDLIDKALSGGCGGIVCAANIPALREAGG